MRLVTYANGEQIGVGVETSRGVCFTGYVDMIALIRDGEAGLARASAAADRGSPVAYDRLLAPIPRPGKILGCGVNYRSHGDEEPGFVFPDDDSVGMASQWHASLEEALAAAGVLDDSSPAAN